MLSDKTVAKIIASECPDNRPHDVLQPEQVERIIQSTYKLTMESAVDQCKDLLVAFEGNKKLSAYTGVSLCVASLTNVPNKELLK